MLLLGVLEGPHRRVSALVAVLRSHVCVIRDTMVMGVRGLIGGRLEAVGSRVCRTAGRVHLEAADIFRSNLTRLILEVDCPVVFEMTHVSRRRELCLASSDMQQRCSCSRGRCIGLTGGRNEVWWGLDLGVDPVDTHTLSALAIRLQAVLAAGRALVALEMTVAAREAAGTGSGRLAGLPLGLRGRGVLCDGLGLLEVVLDLLLLGDLGLLGLLGLLGGLHGEGDGAGHDANGVVVMGVRDAARIASSQREGIATSAFRADSEAHREAGPGRALTLRRCWQREPCCGRERRYSSTDGRCGGRRVRERCVNRRGGEKL